uniref:probable WRKY transcription factor protein 1 isoform X2 n=1 Tax=Anopheles coluzzii TaxID=1518534 RepID=UPI0020FFA8CA|nr:probable WRKY transcription factor protein 1 isoform X2 [Anopheles coluzzii]
MPPSYCSVKGCTNSRSPCCSLYCFPKDVVICKKWVDFCNRPELYKKYDENGPEYLYKSSRICSDHFQPADFNNPNLFSQGLKKGSVPSVNPANLEPAKPHGGNGGGNGIGSGGGGGGGSGSSNGAGSPIDEKLLSAVASIPNLHTNLSLMMAAVAAAATQSASQNASQLSSLTASLKRSASAMSGGSMVAASQGTTASTTTPTATTPVSSSKRNRAVPPLAAPTGALANLIQRQQQIKEQQLKEQQLKDQQRKATALAALGLVNGQVSITPAIIGTPPSNGSSNNNHHHNNNNGGAISLVTTKKSSANNHNNNNNNNNNVSNHNHNHHQQSGKLNNSSSRGRLLDHSEYGLNMVDMDMTAGESSEGDSSYQNSADEDYAYHQKLKVAKVEAVIPPSLKSQLTVTPAGAVTNTSTATTINNNSIHNVNANGGGLVEELHIDYKEKYEQTLKELFACRKIVKNQNKAIQQQQKEIDFLNLLLKEK